MNDEFESQLFANPELTAELIFAAIDLDDLIKQTPSKFFKKQLKEYTEKIDNKIENTFKSNRVTATKINKTRHINSKLHKDTRATIQELNEGIEHNLSDLVVKTQDSLSWVPDSILINFTMTATRALQYLAQFLPTKPSRSLFGLVSNEDYPYSDFEVSRFNRIFTVIEDPVSVLDDLKNNRVNNMSIGAMELVYPEILATMRAELTNSFVDKKTNNKKFDITYQNKINLAKFFNTNVSEFLDPEYVNKLQSILKLSEKEATQGGKGIVAEQNQIPSSATKQRLNES